MPVGTEDTLGNLFISARSVESERKSERINPLGCPPGQFVASGVLFVMVIAAQRDGKFVMGFLSTTGFPLSVERAG